MKINKAVIKQHLHSQFKDEILLGFIGLIPIIGNIAQITGNAVIGYKIGSKLKEPTIGTMFSKEAVVGALKQSKGKYIDISVLDVYTAKNLIVHFLNGIGLSALISAVVLSPHFAIGAAIGGATNALIRPSINYNIGKFAKYRFNKIDKNKKI